MKTEITIALICIIGLLLTMPGCTVIWTDDVFIGTLFKTVDANSLELIAEPNYLQIGSGNSRTENDKVRVITPSVIVETGE